MVEDEPVVGHAASSERASAAALFERDWLTYRKLVENDYLFHGAAYSRLHHVLRELHAPFAFLDVACGDATESIRALEGTRVARYYGIDLSAPALSLAEPGLAVLRCPAELHRGDFVDLLRHWPHAVDAVWIGLAIHHLRASDKLATMKDIRRIVTEGGRLLLYEDALLEGEDRGGWLERWDAQRPSWDALDADEWDRVTAHVHEADFPETAARWLELGREAGFRRGEELLVSPTKLFRLFAYRA